MIRIIFSMLVLLKTFNSFSQDTPPGLIYSCKKNSNGKNQFDIINSSGQKIIKHSVDWAYSNTWSWIFVLHSDTKLKTVYDYYGNKLDIDSIQDSQSSYVDLNRVGIKRNGKWGFYDKEGKLRIAHQYDEISHFNNHMAAVKIGKDVFMIDTNGVNHKIPYNPSNNDYSFQDSDIDIGMGGEFIYQDFKKISENGKFGLFDVKNNKIIIPAEYDNLVDIKVKFKIITGEKAGKYGLIAFDGQIIIPLVYESVFVLNNYF